MDGSRGDILKTSFDITRIVKTVIIMVKIVNKKKLAKLKVLIKEIVTPINGWFKR